MDLSAEMLSPTRLKIPGQNASNDWKTVKNICTGWCNSQPEVFLL